MAVAVRFRFPLGEYHATPWDRAVNSGDSEWPPSPWRILRALLSTWHTRCPSLDAETVDHVVGKLAANLPAYLLPNVQPSHTRHYLPGVGHTEVSRDTAYTLAPRLQLAPDVEIVVLWQEVELAPDERLVLAELVKCLPYLGRAESICDARFLDLDQIPTVDDRWTVPTEEGIDLRVLVPSPEVTRAQLEVTPDAMRKARRLVPEGAAWQGYRNGLASGMPRRADRVARAAPTAMRWALGGPVSIRGRNGVLATSGLRSSALWMLKHLGLEDSEHAWMLAGKHTPAEVKGRHRHAHWLWVSDGDKVTDLVLWVPAPNGIPEEFVPALVGIRSLARLADPPRGYVPAPVHLQAMGRVRDVIPEAFGVSARWSSVTPMLADRHPKLTKSVEWFVRRELERELGFRDWTDEIPVVQSVNVTDSWAAPTTSDGRVNDYRRYRLGETMAQRRRGFRVDVQLDRPIEGPVVLGALSHFGFGRFRPGL